MTAGPQSSKIQTIELFLGAHLYTDTTFMINTSRLPENGPDVGDLRSARAINHF